MSSDRPFLGKFRGTVINNIDPMLIGRLLVQVPDVHGPGISSWAMPCVPVAGINNGFMAVPIPGSGVWVEFEQGNPDYPIWVGCFWGSAAETPVLAKTAPAPTPAITMQTPLKNGLVISDGLGPLGVGGIVIQSATGATLAVNDTGIFINNGKGAQISMVGPTVDINLGALTVT
ncbi:phage baseplate assembly protein V [Paracoccus niistensis]|uniref:Phage baseplate assembly protein V n=1 Tax=Paracoccus niistensis TaxID=632935 RepID=A0ABV6I5B2_9RHOB